MAAIGLGHLKGGGWLPCGSQNVKVIFWAQSLAKHKKIKYSKNTILNFLNTKIHELCK